MLYKKGQGLSMNVIIIAAIALLILVILTTIVLNTGNKVSQTNECESVAGAYCDDLDRDAPRNGCDPGYAPDNFRSCTDEDEICCTPLDSE